MMSRTVQLRREARSSAKRRAARRAPRRWLPRAPRRGRPAAESSRAKPPTICRYRAACRGGATTSSTTRAHCVSLSPDARGRSALARCRGRRRSSGPRPSGDSAAGRRGRPSRRCPPAALRSRDAAASLFDVASTSRRAAARRSSSSAAAPPRACRDASGTIDPLGGRNSRSSCGAHGQSHSARFEQLHEVDRPLRDAHPGLLERLDLLRRRA